MKVCESQFSLWHFVALVYGDCLKNIYSYMLVKKIIFVIVGILIFSKIVMNWSFFLQLPSQMRLFIVHVKSPDCTRWSTDGSFGGLHTHWVEPGLSVWREQKIVKL